MASALRELQDLQGEIRVVFTGPEVQGYRPFRFELSWAREEREEPQYRQSFPDPESKGLRKV